MTELRDYRGALHVHSRYSDGSGPVEEIVEAAQAAGLDLLLIADHNTLAARTEGWVGWHGSTLVMVADEITPPGRAHVLALGVSDIEGLQYLSEPAYLERVAGQGGLAILAHPEGKPDVGFGASSQPWFHWRSPGYDALEVWSYMHDWIDGLRWWQVPGACLRPHRRISGPDRHLLGLWDGLLKERDVCGVAALDAHAAQVLAGTLHIFPYRDLFHTTLTHILVPPLSGEAAQDEAAVIEALRQGRAYITFELLSPVEAFTFAAERGGERWLPISRLPAGPTTALLVRAPEPAEIRLLHDGRVRATADDRGACWQVSEPGVYRVELYLAGRPWIFSNPICIVPVNE